MKQKTHHANKKNSATTKINIYNDVNKINTGSAECVNYYYYRFLSLFVFI